MARALVLLISTGLMVQEALVLVCADVFGQGFKL